MSGPYRSWCYTINNPTEGDVEFVKNLICKRHVCTKEVGENGTPHLQGSITFPCAYRLSALKKLHSRAHWEKTIASEASFQYCLKEKSEIVVQVDNRRQGARNDIRDFWMTLGRMAIYPPFDPDPRLTSSIILGSVIPLICLRCSPHPELSRFCGSMDLLVLVKHIMYLTRKGMTLRSSGSLLTHLSSGSMDIVDKRQYFSMTLD